MQTTTHAVALAVTVISFGVTAALLPGIAYVSVASHGAHGAAFLLLLYAVCLVAMRATSLGGAFLLGALAAVAAVLIPMLLVSARTTLLILLPVMLAEALRRSWVMFRAV